MVQKLFKALLVVFLIVPMHVGADRKNKTLCSLLVTKLCVKCNANIGGNLSINGNLITNGNGTFGGSITTGTCTLTCTPAGLVVTSPVGTATIGAGILGYGYIYNLAPQTVAIEAPVIFSNNGSLL